MIRFIILGLWRDKSRSRLPIIVVTIGVMLTVFMHAYITGFMGDTIELNAKFTTGHVKVVTKAYAEYMSQHPNDLAILNADELKLKLQRAFPDLVWDYRIQFGGLIDAPDSVGQTKSQGPVFGLGIDLLSPETNEIERLSLAQSLVRGKMPAAKNEVLLSDEFAIKLKVNPGDLVTLIGSTMNGSMAMHNFKMAGTLSFGVEIMDRGAIVVDIEDVRQTLEMHDAAGEILGFFKEGFYNHEQANAIAERFNIQYEKSNDAYAPVMMSLSNQGNMGQYVQMVDTWAGNISFIFIFAMSLVLWNAGLLGGLRRYGEVGVRLAIGEEKGHVYRSMIFESLFIGLVGSVFGTILGLFFAYLLQTYGIDISGLMHGASVMFPTLIKARISTVDFYLGFFPGVISTVIGTLLSGIGIYKRQTAKLFKELEA